jgi:hypothetical protein
MDDANNPKYHAERKAQEGPAGRAIRERSGAGKGDRTSSSWITSDKYQRSMAANDAYANGEITLEEWRAIVHPKKPEGQGDD